jgi:phosphatidylglycerophosphatase A
MPGTVGTLLGVPLAWLLVHTGPNAYLFITALLVVGSSFIAELYERNTEAHDPGEVVIDEVVGYLIAFAWLPLTWQSFVAAFVVFRFFDILKPFPISVIDRKIEGGLGTILDDVAAGLITNVLLQIVAAKTSWLGGFGVFYGEN